MATRLTNFAVPAACLLILSGCFDGGQGAAIRAAANAAETSPEPVPQQFEITIDGVRHTMAPDKPEDGHVTSASLVSGRAFTVTTMDKALNLTFQLSLQAPGGAALVPGTYQLFDCRYTLGCDEQAHEKTATASYGTYPGVKQYAPGDLKTAQLAPKVGLTPLTLTIEKVEDTYWRGAGPSKRVKGHFKGALAFVEEPRDLPPRIVGGVKQVEGSFDMYTVLR